MCFGGGPHADRGGPLAAEMEHVFPVLELHFAQAGLQTVTGSSVSMTWAACIGDALSGRTSGVERLLAL